MNASLVYDTAWFNEASACFCIVLASLLFLNDLQMLIWLSGLGERRHLLWGPLIGLVRCVWQTSYFVSSLGMAASFALFYIHGIFFEIMVQVIGVVVSRLMFNYQIFYGVSWRDFSGSDHIIIPKLSYVLFIECACHISIFTVTVAIFPFWTLTSNITHPLALIAFVGNIVAFLHVFILDYVIWYRTVRTQFEGRQTLRDDSV